LICYKILEAQQVFKLNFNDTISREEHKTVFSCVRISEMTSIICYNFKDGWLDAEELGCFKFLETDTDLVWVEAQQKCEAIGGYLAEPSTARSTITH
jgi:hypothetical protein